MSDYMCIEKTGLKTQADNLIFFLLFLHSMPAWAETSISEDYDQHQELFWGNGGRGLTTPA